MRGGEESFSSFFFCIIAKQIGTTWLLVNSSTSLLGIGRQTVQGKSSQRKEDKKVTFAQSGREQLKVGYLAVVKLFPGEMRWKSPIRIRIDSVTFKSRAEAFLAIRSSLSNMKNAPENAGRP